MLESLISAGSAIASGLFGQSNNQANLQAQREFNAQQAALARENMAMQREFAQQGIRWKVADAQAAGLHPLAALGAQTSSFSPVSLGGEAPKSENVWGNMSQDLTRAAKAMASAQQREAVDAQRERELNLESKKLDNDIKKTALVSRAISTSRMAGQLGPSVPLPRPGPIRDVAGLAVAEDDLKQKQGDIPSQRISRPFGYELTHNPYFSDGQVSEDRYGDSEILSTVKAAANLIADHAYTGYLKGDWSNWWRGGDRSKFRYRGFNR